MKKLFILALATILLTGCTIVRINTKSIDNIVSVVLSKNNKLYNRVGKGYKYYIPRGVSYIDTTELNEKLYSDGNYYYLYIDAISYYYKKTAPYTLNKDAYYSIEINNNDKQGYLEIIKKDELYYIQFMYNYSKIEAVVTKNDIEGVILNASYILSTIKFNSNIIKLMLDQEYFANREEKYDIFTPQTKIDTNLNTPNNQITTESN